MTINIQMDDDAFEPNKWIEVSRILRKLALNLDNGRLPDTVIDSNGNTAGTIVYGGDS